MYFSEELYFEITLAGRKSEINKFVSFLTSGGLDDFFPVCEDYIYYDDSFEDASDAQECSITFTNDECGIEIDEFDSDDFLEVLCRVSRSLDVRGRLYDIDDEEYSFVSREGDSYYLNADRIDIFNDELDEHAAREEEEESDS